MQSLYAFDRCEVRPAERQLLIDGKPAPLGARAFDLLVALIERRDRVVAKPELFDAVWPGLVVEENNLQVQVSSLRKLLGPSAIATIPSRGYRFVAPVDVEDRRTAPARQNAEANPNNLPPAAHALHRSRESARRLRGACCRGTRLLTLSGIGGCGKTRLARELAQRQSIAFPGRRLVRRPRAAAGGAARVRDGRGHAGGSGQRRRARSTRLTDHLKSRRTLVVLDNCEHVIDAAVESIEALLSAMRRVEGHRDQPRGAWHARRAGVRSALAVAAGVDGHRRDARSEAVRLFVDHARLVVPEFASTSATRRDRRDLPPPRRHRAGDRARRRARAGPVGRRDSRRLDDRFRLLTGGSRAMPRHQTLQATMQWSHDLLTLPEQRLFRRLAVFAGGCTLAAARAVADDGADEYDTLERLTALHDKSLLLVDRDSHALPRYRMLETVRQYAEERLNEAGEGEAIRTRHLQDCVGLVEEAEPALNGLHGAACIRDLPRTRKTCLRRSRGRRMRRTAASSACD